MLIDAYTFFKEHPKYNKLIGDDYLFLEYKCPIEVDKAKIWSECHYITHVISGKKKWCTPNKEWTITAGESIFVHKGVYMNRQYFEPDYCVLMFFLTDDFIKAFVEEDLKRKPSKKVIDAGTDPIYKINVTDTLISLYSSVFTYLTQQEPAPKAIVELKFKELLLNILSDRENKELTDFILAIANYDQYSLPGIMEKNFFYNLSMEEFARLCGRSLSSFKRDFKEMYNTTPGKWLTDRRLKYAKNQLLTTDKNVQEVCYDCGFENPSHFARTFKKKYRDSPLQYRKKFALASEKT